MKNFLRAAALVVAVAISTLSPPAKASQNSCIMPNTGTVSGLVLVNDITACANSILTLYSGGSPPSSPLTGMMWLNTSVTPNVVQQYDGTNWQTWGAMDATSHVWTPPVGGGFSTVTAAATTDLCSVAPAVIQINGTTTITSFGSSCAVGVRKTVIFSNATPLTYNATSMVIPGLANYTTASGDFIDVIYFGSGNWRIINIERIDGTSVTNPAVPLGTMLFGMYATAPNKFVLAAGQAISRASFPQYLAAVTRTQTVTSTSGNNTLTSVPNTAGLGVGMPVEGSNIPAGTVITSVTSSTIVMSQNASSSTTPSVTVFLTGYGASGSTSTVGVPNCKGRMIAGRDDMLGTAANNITSAYFGSSATAVNAMGGLQTAALSVGNLASHNHAVFLNDPGHIHGVTHNANSNNSPGSPAGGGGGPYVGPANAAITILSNTTGITVRDTTGGGGTANQTASSGSGTAFGILNPILIAECIIAVSP